MPGQTLGPALPYLFDLVMAMRIGTTEKNEEYRYLQTFSDIQYIVLSCYFISDMIYILLHEKHCHFIFKVNL